MSDPATIRSNLTIQLSMGLILQFRLREMRPCSLYIHELNVLASCCSKKRLEGGFVTAILFMGCRIIHGIGKAMTPSNAEALIVFLFYCLAVHVTQQERRKLR